MKRQHITVRVPAPFATLTSSYMARCASHVGTLRNVMRHSQIMRTLLQIVLLGVTAGACGAQQPDGSPVPTVRGHYVWGAEVNVFSPCGSELEYWVVAEPETMTSLRDQYLAFDLPPYEAVFTEVRGEFGPVLDCGFCEKYDGSFRVAEILAVESPGPEDCETEMGGGATANGP